MKFNEFIGNKYREAKRHLEVIKDVFVENNFKIINNLDDRKDPHIFVYNPKNNLSFTGIRIYEIANNIAYRVQKESDTHPYGKAYLMPIEMWYEESEGQEDMTAAKEVAKLIVQEVKEFFSGSEEAEKKIGSQDKKTYTSTDSVSSLFDQMFNKKL